MCSTHLLRPLAFHKILYSSNQKKKNKLCNRSTNHPTKKAVRKWKTLRLNASLWPVHPCKHAKLPQEMWTTSNVQIKSLGSTNILIMIFFCGGAPLESLICFWWVYEIYDFWWNPFRFGIFFYWWSSLPEMTIRRLVCWKAARGVVEGETGAMWLNFDWFCGGVPTDSQPTNQPADRATYSNRHMFTFLWKFQ